MLFCMIALWTIALVLLIVNGKSESARWGAAIAISGGFGGCSRVLLEQVRPFLLENNIFGSNVIFIDILRSACSFVSHSGPPYTYLIFSLCYSGLLNVKQKKVSKLVFFIPVVIYFFSVPVFPLIEHNYKILDVWAVPYIVAANIILIYSTLKEKNRIIRKSRIYVTFVAALPMTFDLIYGYIAKFFEQYELFRVNTAAVLVMFMLFVAFLIKDGFLGVKLNIERQSLESKMKAITSGTTILNHTIKNEVAKISVLANNTKNIGLSEVNVEENMDYILSSTDYILTMINKIQQQIKPVELELNEHNLGDIIDRVLNDLIVYIKDKKITVKKSYCSDIRVICDALHIKEVFNNIITNAIEASKVEGIIEINITRTRKTLLVAVKDNGKGISKENLPHVMDPFFTTKRRENNYGLGLSYCYNIMQLHGGTLEIDSKENIGTTVYVSLKINRRKILGKHKVV